MSMPPDGAAADHVDRLRQHRTLTLDELGLHLREALEAVGQVRTLGIEIDHAFGVAEMVPTVGPDVFRDQAASLIDDVVRWLRDCRDTDPIQAAIWQQKIDNLARAAQLLALQITEV